MCPNIATLYETYEDENRFILILEHFEGVNLYEFMRDLDEDKFTEKTISNIISQIIKAANAFHNSGLAHRDLRPDNIMISADGSHVKIIEFGFSRILKGINEKYHSPLLNPLYISPEMAGKQPYNKMCDIWSIGIICYVLLSGSLPYNIKPSSTPKEILAQIESKMFSVTDFSNPVWKTVSNDAKDFVFKMLEYYPEKRLSTEDLLKHKWVVNPPEKQNADKTLVKNALKNIASYQDSEIFQKAVFQYLAFNSDIADEGKILKSLFDKYDTDKSHSLSKVELKKALDENGMTMLDSELDELFQNVKADAHGSINYNEFMRVLANQKLRIKEQLVEDAFFLLDKQGTGSIEFNIVKISMKRSWISEKQINDLLISSDLNNNKKVFFSLLKLKNSWNLMNSNQC